MPVTLKLSSNKNVRSSAHIHTVHINMHYYCMSWPTFVIMFHTHSKIIRNSFVSCQRTTTIPYLFSMLMYSCVSFSLPFQAPSKDIQSTSLISFQQSKRLTNNRLYSSSSSSSAGDPHIPFRNHTHNSLLVVIPDVPSQNATQENELLYNNKTLFSSSLKAMLTTAKAMQKSSVWIQVPMSRSSLMEELQPLGFRFHHAHEFMAHLYLWLDDRVPCKIPDYATHQVVSIILLFLCFLL